MICFKGIGTGLGSLIGGIVYDRLGGRAMFGTVAFIATISLVLYWWAEGVKFGDRGKGRINRPFRYQIIDDDFEDFTSFTDTVTTPNKSLLTMEVAHPKKGKQESRPSEDHDDEQYRFGVFGENTF